MLAALTRPVLCGRIHAVRRALDELQAQADHDGHGCISGYGGLKVTLIQYEQQLRDHDAAERSAAVSQAAREIALAPWQVIAAAVVQSARPAGRVSAPCRGES